MLTNPVSAPIGHSRPGDLAAIAIGDSTSGEIGPLSPCRKRFEPWLALWAVVLLALMLVSTFPASAALCLWQGESAGSNAKWSVTNNWMRYTNITPCGPWLGAPGLPQNGDDLVFGEFSEFGGDPDPMINDLVGLVVNSMRFSGEAPFLGDIEWTLSGNPITISNSFTPLFSYTDYGLKVGRYSTDTKLHLNCDLILATDVTCIVGGCDYFYSCFNGWVWSCPDPGVTDYLYLNGQVHLNGNDLLLKGQSADYSPSGTAKGRIQVGRISGAGDVRVILELDSSLRFKSATGNAFTGWLTLRGEPGSQTVFDVSGGAVATNLLSIYSQGVVEYAAPNQVGDAALVLIANGAKLQMNGHSDAIGDLILGNDESDTLPSTLDTGGGTLTLNGHLQAYNYNSPVAPVILGRVQLPGGPHTFQIIGSTYPGLDLQAELTGTGNLTKTGANALILKGNNSSFGGSFLISEGVLDVRHNNALGDALAGTVILEGALRLQNVTIAAEPLTAAGQGIGGDLPGSVMTCVGINTWHGPILLNTNLNIIGDIILVGPISGVGGIGGFGGGTVQFAGVLPNSYTGTTLVRSRIEFAKQSGTKAFAGPLVVGGGTGGPYEARWLNSYQNVGANVTLHANGVVNLLNNNEDFGFVTFNGGTVETGTGEFAIYQPLTVNPNASTAVINGKLGLPPGPVMFEVGDGAAHPDLLVNAVVFGSGSPVRKRGPGTLHFTGTNTYTGVTLVEAGTLHAEKPAALGSGAMTINVSSNATLSLGSGGILSKGVFISGPGGPGANGALSVVNDGSWMLTGGLTLNHPSTIHVGLGSSLNVNSMVSGTGPLTKTGPGSLTFAGADGNNYFGDTIVLGGGLNLSKNTPFTLAVPGNLIIGPASALMPAWVQLFQSGPIGGTNFTVNANSALDLNGHNESVWQLTLNDGGDVQTGAGILAFLPGGSLVVGSQYLFGSEASSSITGNLMLPPNDTLTISVAPYNPLGPLLTDPELDVPAVIRGEADDPFQVRARIAKEGFGAMRLSGNNSTFAGTASVNQGRLIVAGAGALGATNAATFINNNATLALQGGITVTNETLFSNSTNSPALDSVSGTNTWTGPISLGVNTIVNANQGLVLSGVISGTAHLTKIGLGQLTLGGPTNNTFVGDTFVQRGTLRLQKANSRTAIPRHVFVGNGTGPAVLHQVANDQIAGAVTVNADGVWNFGAQFETFASATPPPITLNDGGGIVTSGSGTITLPVGGQVVVNPGSSAGSTISADLGLAAGGNAFVVAASTTPGTTDLTLTGSLDETGGPAGFQKQGAGKMRLAGGGVIYGASTVNAGILQVDGFFGDSPFQVHTGTLQGGGTIGPVSFTGASGVITPGASTGIFNCKNFHAGAPGSGTLRMELNGPTPGSDHDRLNVTGTVNLNGVTLQLMVGGHLALSNQVMLIANDGTDAVTGTFTGLPQGANVSAGSQIFQISYTGGTGNDVVLTKIADLPPPVLHIERLSAALVRLSWSTNYSDFNLQYNLTPHPTNWAAALPLPVVLGSNFVVTNTALGGQRLYRLSRLPAPYTPPPPTLRIERVSSSAVRLLWPVDALEFSLQSNTNLATTNWIGVSPTPVLSGADYVVTNSLSGAQKFYRLFKP